ncbi:hypothetical protein GYMLUDRAFT_251208 [Collybiopsis luxurians FD-317 M1]|uniref:Uncharacterized protein n=1 Tax=Collybiopsis luxurians FD-317 M1 TaxID=944289 RepID=A0A0D0CCB9_9AGAR|nr:hypothetical protein GYMLUDRAFT_251208 [Collybiopsis luxurians FD-317 M1]
MTSVNYLLTDGVVIWRAWVLCSADGTKALKLSLLMLCLGTVSVITTVAIRTILMIINTENGLLFDRLTQGINVAQIGALVLFVLTNSITSTSLVSIKAWKVRSEFQRTQNVAVGIGSRTGKTFALVIESGILYTISCVTAFTFSLIPLKDHKGTLGDIYTPVNTQLAGLYPVAVLLLVTSNQTLDRTVRAFASGVDQTGFHVTTEELTSTIHFEHRSTISIGSGVSEIDGDRDGHRQDFTTGGVTLSPLIPSGKIIWGHPQEDV